MSEYQLIGRISLTEAEEKLYRQIPNLKERIRNRDYLEAGEWERIADCMECLADSLIERNAIHPNRLRIFDSKDAAERGKKSTKERFESNGKVDREILRHPHFLETLRYFVEGPDLPKEAMTRFIDILDSCDTNGGIVKKSLIHVRATVRKYNLDRSEAATQFFRLAIELGMSLTEAKGFRKAALAVR